MLAESSSYLLKLRLRSLHDPANSAWLPPSKLCLAQHVQDQHLLEPSVPQVGHEASGDLRGRGEVGSQQHPGEKPSHGSRTLHGSSLVQDPWPENQNRAS